MKKILFLLLIPFMLNAQYSLGTSSATDWIAQAEHNISEHWVGDSTFAIEYWIKLDSININQSGYISGCRLNTTSNVPGWMIYIQANSSDMALQIRTDNSSVRFIQSGTITLTLNTWHFTQWLVSRHDLPIEDTVFCWVDGQKILEEEASSLDDGDATTASPAFVPLTICGWLHYNEFIENSFNGKLYNYSLWRGDGHYNQANRYKNRYIAPASGTLGLAALYAMPEGAGLTTADGSGNANNLTLSNKSMWSFDKPIKNISFGRSDSLIFDKSPQWDKW